MGGFLNELFGNVADASADPTITLNSITATAGSASACLMAELEATTPEVRRLFGEYSTQSVMANEALMAFAINRNWINPYQAPEKQLQDSLSHASAVISKAQQP